MAELNPLAQAVVDAHYGAPPLSPAAQAVADAYDNTPELPTGNHRYRWLAAALRAAADQVQHHWDGMECVDHLQAIAAELEATTRDPLESNDLSHLSDEVFLALAPQGYHAP